MTRRLRSYHLRTALRNLPLLLLPFGARALSGSVRIGTRASPLALVQAEAVASALIKASAPGDPRPEIVPFDATGDHRGKRAGKQDAPLAMTAVDFTGILDDALLAGKIDLAVHSLKDVPPANRWRAGLTIGCHLGPRADPSDVLVGPYESIASLPPGARVGSASVRRQAQVLASRPDVSVVNVRGNVHARLAALESGDVDVLILASAGLERLGLMESNPAPDDAPHRYHPIPFETMLPGCAQGIIVAVCRSDDDETIALLRRADDLDARIAATAELSLLDAVDGSAPWPGRPPVAALMERNRADREAGIVDRDGSGDGSSCWTLRGLLASPDGSSVVRARREAPTDCDERRRMY